MMETIKIILKIVVALVFGLGLWYGIFFFLTVEPNPLNWHWGTKLAYLFLGLASADGIFQGLTE